MKVFLSWSGNRSHKVALVFRDWFPSVIQSIVPYVSSEDIDKGARWSTDIAKELADSTFGILCVTKDNINAPWLTFEAGALSKTMEKSFVSPFLFDLKRSEVDGPILQFQSTIFEKEDIRKLVKTLNKAIEQERLLDERLDKAFEVWYPTLEAELKKVELLCEPSNPNESNHPEENGKSEILEEILELTRINQKLLRNPGDSLAESMAELKNGLLDLRNRQERCQDIHARRIPRRLHPMFFEELMHLAPIFDNSYIGIQVALSLLKDDFPWIYDAGREVLTIFKSRKPRFEKVQAVEEFKRILEFTVEHPMMRDMFANNKELRIFYKDLPFIFMQSLEKVDRSDKAE